MTDTTPRTRPTTPTGRGLLDWWAFPHRVAYRLAVSAAPPVARVERPVAALLAAIETMDQKITPYTEEQADLIRKALLAIDHFIEDVDAALAEARQQGLDREAVTEAMREAFGLSRALAEDHAEAFLAALSPEPPQSQEGNE